VQRHIVRFEDDLRAGANAEIIQITRDLCLSVYDNAGSSERLQIDPEAVSLETYRKAIVKQRMFIDLGADTSAPQQFGRSALQYARTNPAFDIGAAAALQQHAVHTAKMQELEEQKTRRSAANDCHLRFHF